MPDDTRSLVQRQFGVHAQGYVTSPSHARGVNLARLLDAVSPSPGARALDIATGGGHTALGLAGRGASTVAGDLTGPMLIAAREHIGATDAAGRVVYVRLEAGHLPFGAAVFDVVTCRIAPHHFPDVAQFMRETARVVRPGGVVGVIDQLTPGDPQTARYINAFERLRDPSHVWAYNRVEWEGFFVGAGLVIEQYEEFAVEQQLARWAELMGNDAPTTTRLRAMLVHAPPPAAAWMEPRLSPAGEVTFTTRQFLLVGRRK